MTIHGAVVMDFLFIQQFGWIRIIIAWGRKTQNPSGLNIMVSTREVSGDHNDITNGYLFSEKKCTLKS
jgi:hypothetical protein